MSGLNHAAHFSSIFVLRTVLIYFCRRIQSCNNVATSWIQYTLYQEVCLCCVQKEIQARLSQKVGEKLKFTFKTSCLAYIIDRNSNTIINYPRQHINFITSRLDYMFRPINWSSSGPIILGREQCARFGIPSAFIWDAH